MASKTEQQESQFLPDLCHGHAVLVVVLVAELMAIVLALMSTYYEAFSLTRLALSSFFMQWVGLSCASLLCWLRQPLNRWPMTLAAVAVVVLVAIDTFIMSLLARMLENWLFGTSLFLHLMTPDVLRNVLIAIIITGMVMRYFYVQEELKHRRESELQARIQALQSRIRPHFLFNSMNIIASLISIEPETAEQVVDDMSQLFRASLRESSEEITLERELDLCRHYIHIEQLRLGDRLKVDWQIDDKALSQPIPLLTLQPLLENAVYHGIQPLPQGGQIEVQVEMHNNRVEMCISNPVGADQKRGEGNRMALENVRHRLEAIYGKQAWLDVSSTTSQYQVGISYPCCHS